MAWQPDRLFKQTSKFQDPAEFLQTSQEKFTQQQVKLFDQKLGCMNIAQDRLPVQEEQWDRDTALACCMPTIKHNAAAVGKPGGGGGGGRFGGSGAGGGGAEGLLAGRLTGANSLLMVIFIISKSCNANFHVSDSMCVTPCE